MSGIKFVFKCTKFTLVLLVRILLIFFTDFPGMLENKGINKVSIYIQKCACYKVSDDSKKNDRRVGTPFNLYLDIYYLWRRMLLESAFRCAVRSPRKRLP